MIVAAPAVKLRLLSCWLLCFAPAVLAQVPMEDPWESWNRKVFAFNEQVDRYLMKPVAESYRKVTPDPLERNVSSLFSNVGELPVSGNALLQGKPSSAGISLLRFLVNSTVGIFGLFDVASDIGLAQQKEDFDQTLAVWGVPAGHYLVLPFFGPSSPRATAGLTLDIYANPLNVEHWPTRISVWALKVVDTRAGLLKAESLISGDRYIFMRDAWQQQRHYLINDGVVEDTFDSEGFEDDDWLD